MSRLAPRERPSQGPGQPWNSSKPCVRFAWGPRTVLETKAAVPGELASWGRTALPVRLQNGVLDPQGGAIERALPALGFDGAHQPFHSMP